MDSVKKVVAVASMGGHFIQLMRLRKLLDEYDAVYVSTYREVDGLNYRCVPDANSNNKLKAVWSAFCVLRIVLKERPDIVITTGAAPGYFAILFGSCFGARTIWIDSIANAAELSMAGKKAMKYADLCLTQWPDLIDSKGPKYFGSVM